MLMRLQAALLGVPCDWWGPGWHRPHAAWATVDSSRMPSPAVHGWLLAAVHTWATPLPLALPALAAAPLPCTFRGVIVSLSLVAVLRPPCRQRHVTSRYPTPTKNIHVDMDTAPSGVACC